MSNTIRKDKNGKEYKESLKKKDGHFRCRCEHCLGKKNVIEKIAEKEMKEEDKKQLSKLDLSIVEKLESQGKNVSIKLEDSLSFNGKVVFQDTKIVVDNKTYSKENVLVTKEEIDNI